MSFPFANNISSPVCVISESRSILHPSLHTYTPGPTAAATTSQAATTSSAVFPTEGTFTISQGLEQPCTIYASTSAATAVLVVLLAVIAVLLLVVVLLLCAVCSLHRRRRDTRKLA